MGRDGGVGMEVEGEGVDEGVGGGARGVGLHIGHERREYLLVGVYEGRDIDCIVLGERFHSEIPRLLLVKFWASCNKVGDPATA